MVDLIQQVADKGNAELGIRNTGVQPAEGANKELRIPNIEVEKAEDGAGGSASIATESMGVPPAEIGKPDMTEQGSGGQEAGSREQGVDRGNAELGIGNTGVQPATGGGGQATDVVVSAETMKDMVAKISSRDGASVAGAMSVEKEVRAQREAGGQAVTNE